MFKVYNSSMLLKCTERCIKSIVDHQVKTSGVTKGQQRGAAVAPGAAGEGRKTSS